MYKVLAVAVLVVVLVAAVVLVMSIPANRAPEAQLNQLVATLAPVAVVPVPLDPLAIPAERPGWVQYETLAKERSTRPHLRILGVKIARDAEHDNNIGLNVAIKNIGSITCKRCWLLLSTQAPGQKEPTPRSWILAIPSSDPLDIGDVRHRHWWVDESSKERVEAWRLEFDSYVGPKDP